MKEPITYLHYWNGANIEQLDREMLIEVVKMLGDEVRELQESMQRMRANMFTYGSGGAVGVSNAK